MRGAESLLVVALGVAVTAAAAEEAPPRLEVSVPAAAVSVGDPVAVRAQVRDAEGWLLGELEVGCLPNGPWEVVDGPRAVAGARPPAWQVVLAPMALGELELPAMSVSARRSDGEALVVEGGATAPVTVASVLAPGGPNEPAPLRDPVGVRGLPWEWLAPAAVLAMPVLAAVALWLRRRRPAGIGGRAELSPAEELRLALGELVERIGRLPADGLCDGLSTALRRYLERRTGEPALEMTSFELRRLGRARGWPEEVRRPLQRALDTADSVRFGRRPASQAQLHAAVEAGAAVAAALEHHLRPAADEVPAAEARAS